MSFISTLDTHIAESLKSWNIYTTALALVISAVFIYPVFFPSEPDTHPLLLARQSVAAPIRRKGESALYRASEVPHGFPLKSGLDVKDPAAPRWAAGKNGDLRDVWREVAKGGSTGLDGKEIPKGLIMRVIGKEVEEHEIEELSKEITTLGQHFKQAGIKKLAIYLPNNVEYLLAIFACSFYGLSPILLPFNLSESKVYDLLNTTEADALLATAGSLPLDDVTAQCNKIKNVTLVVEKTSRDIDWNAESGKVQSFHISVWHELVAKKAANASSTLPDNSSVATPPNLYTIWQGNDNSSSAQVASFTHANLVAGMAGLITALPLRQRFTSADLIVPADSFSNTYVLLYTFVALFSHASVAVNSVAGPGVELSTATSAIKPTVIITSAETLAKHHAKDSGISGTFQKLGMATQSQTMAAGRMPTDTFLFRLLAPSPNKSTPGQLRLLLTSERLGADTPPLTSSMLSDLRIFTKARIVYALTSANVAGAIAQSNVFDYRVEAGTGCSTFGGPLGSVEVKVVNETEGDVKGSQHGVSGSLVVSGPAVAGGSVDTKTRCAIRADGTIAYS